MIKEDPYRSIARWYDRLFEWSNKKVGSIGLGISVLKEGMEVLDVGCGTGTLLAACQRQGCAVYGIDCSPAMLAMARRTLGKKAQLLLGDASQMPYRDGSFDLAMAMLALHEMSQATRCAVLGEMRRVVKHDGHVLIVDYHAGPLQPLSGWWTKLIIVFAEMAAGGEHFRNYREFIKRKGIPPLVESRGFEIRKQRIVGGGAIGVFSLKKT